MSECQDYLCKLVYGILNEICAWLLVFVAKKARFMAEKKKTPLCNGRGCAICSAIIFCASCRAAWSAASEPALERSP